MELIGSKRRLLEIVLDFLIFDFSSWQILNRVVSKRGKSKKNSDQILRGPSNSLCPLSKDGTLKSNDCHSYRKCNIR
jgi:hypothetical protein